MRAIVFANGWDELQKISFWMSSNSNVKATISPSEANNTVEDVVERLETVDTVALVTVDVTARSLRDPNVTV